MHLHLEEKRRAICTLYLIYTFTTVFVQIIGNETIQVMLKTDDVWEGESFIMSCTFQTNTHIKSSRWTSDKLPTDTTIVFKDENNNCNTFGLFNSTEYSVDCSIRNEFSVLVRRANKSYHLSQWSCRHASSESSPVKIVVNVQIQKLTLTYKGNVIAGEETVDIKENSDVQAVCTSSFGRPLPDIKWFKYTGGKTSLDKVLIGEVHAKDTAMLQYNTSRDDNGVRIGCVASNRINFSIASKKVSLNVFYPPEGPTIKPKGHGTTYKVIEKYPGHITCYVYGGNPRNATLTWSCFRKKTLRYSSGEYTAVLEWVALHTQSGNCTCTSVHIAGTKTASVFVEVLYPPRTPRINLSHKEVTGNILVFFNNSLSLSCNASSNPESNIRWRLPNNSILQGHALHIHRILMSKEGNYTCFARNKMIASDASTENGSNSTSVQIQVLFPPSDPEFKYKNESGQPIERKQLRVLKGRNVTVACVSRGNPHPSRQWLNDKNNSSLLTFYNVSKDFTKTCNASNIMIDTSGEQQIGASTSTLSVSVLYPPYNPSLRLQYGNVSTMIESSSNVNIIENTSFTILCNTISNPPPEYTWAGHAKIPSQTLTIHDVKRKQSGVYTCHTSNTMQPSFESTVTGNSDANISINILYPPDIDEMKNGSAVEGLTFSIQCPVLPGNPSNQTVQWKSEDNNLIISSSMLSIRNVSRDDDMTFTCIVSYTMKPTGDIEVVGEVSKPFYLTVFYRAVVTKFTATDFQTDTDVIVNNSDTVLLGCAVDSNPDSNISIVFNKNIIVRAAKSKRLTYNIAKADCSDAGVYTCIGGNDYNNGSMARANLTMFVKCKPKPSMVSRPVQTIESALHMSATLQFTAASYLDPGETGFMWMRQHELEWIPLRNDTNIVITSYGLQANLTIISATNTDFGEYLLVCNNSVGSSNFTFILMTAASTSTAIESHSLSSLVIVAATVPTAVIVTIFGIIAVVLIYRKRNSKETERVYQNVPFTGKHNKIQRRNESLHIEETEFEGLQEVDDVPIITQERTEYSNSPDIIEKLEIIKVAELFPYVSDRGEESFEADFQKLPTGLQKPCTFARKPENIALNRYNGIYPYDHSRVKLKGQPDFFINACYIDGYKSSRKYIASLGPTATTTSNYKTFWEMIWYERSDVIVMLTNLREPSGMKCEKYWPDKGASIWYGDVCVSSVATDCFAEYTIRTFTVSKEEEQRSLTHLHYTAWPDKTVPEDVTNLIDFRQKMKATPTSSEGPIVVHCSAGIGRTGTLIALDRLIEEGQDTGSVNVFECVNNMREQRVKMVQTFEQYMYIYKALVNALTFDSETIPVETFQEYVDTTSNNVYSMMFQQLKHSVETDSKADKEARCINEKNTNKNRRGADIPGSRFRALLYLNRGDDETSEYINAVYINSFKTKDYFIAAQSPLPGTVVDFITMLYQEDCACIATMEDLKEPGMTVGQYLPDNKKTLTIGNFKVSSSRLETKDNFVVRKIKIKFAGKFDSGEKSIYHFQYTKWMTGHDIPVDVRTFVLFVNEVNEYANELGEEGSHVIVHCLKANERSGLFCALAILMEKIKFEREVNVLNTLRHLRKRRQTAITSMEQLKFCYQATSTYINIHG